MFPKILERYSLETSYPWYIVFFGTVLVIILVVYISALFFSKAGEVAGALGSFLGGIIGAGGAVWAVYLALSQQRKEEIAKVSDAVRIEVTTLINHVIGAIEICEKISKRELPIPKQGASPLSKMLWFNPVIYPAVADRVGLLPHPEATTGFYMRIAEAKAVLDLMQIKPQQSSATNVSAPPDNVIPQDALSIVECLITALQLAVPIIANTSDHSAKTQLGSLVQQTILSRISECLNSAKVSFPNAESFK